MTRSPAARPTAGRWTIARVRRCGPDEVTPPKGPREPIAGLFAATLFVGAALLFCVQPMVARLVLPTLGGSPAVWNACQVFFQAALLAGYLYAHALARRAALPVQAAIHGGVLLLAWWALPIGVATAAMRGPAAGSSPVGWLLATLLTTVGLPFFAVAATSPLLQRWYASAGTRGSADPYVLYAASNLGSMLALAAYPLLIEPTTDLATQPTLWSAGFGLLALLIATSGVAAILGARRAPVASDEPATDATAAPPPTPGRRLRWMALAFVPSSLMLGVTTYITTDLAAVPLLWVVPLGLYLLTFIIVFARRPWIRPAFAAACLPPALLLLAWNQAAGAEPGPSLLLLHLGVDFLVALVCHGALAADRPPARHLTGFYLAMSAGGVLGGLFNALAAPLLFSLIVEYPLVLGLACLALPRGQDDASSTRRRAWGLAVATMLALLAVALGRGLALSSTTGAGIVAASLLARVAGGVVAGLALVGYRRRPAWLATVVLALLFLGFLPAPGDGEVLWRGRDFFGVLTVTRNEHDHRLVHGRTLHGLQDRDPATAGEPRSYYHRSGPVGALFAGLDARPDAAGRPRSVAIVGLGAGSMAAYARPAERWTFFEIDPAVVRVATDPRYFTYLARCKAGAVQIITGDARLRLREAPDHAFDLLVLDAFSSDAIPVHLLTREAIDLYRRKLAPGGVLAFHISNRFLDLAPVLATHARHAGLTCLVRADLAVTPAAQADGQSPSIWAILAPASHVPPVPTEGPARWVAPRPDRPGAEWTDGYSDVVPRLLGWR